MARLLLNEAIIAHDVLLYDEEGHEMGIFSRVEALAIAREHDCDLLQEDVASSPPRCRLMAQGSAGNRLARTARIAAGGPPKEIRVATTMGSHDVATRIRQARGLLAKGYTVKLTVRLAKAERSNPVAARSWLDHIAHELADEGGSAGKPFNESGALSLLISPAMDV